MPETEKAVLKKEYKLRVIAAALMFLFFSLAIACLMLFPAYMFSKVKSQIASDTLAQTARARLAGEKELIEKAGVTKQIIISLRPGTGTDVYPSEIIDKIVSDRGEGNTITSISYSREPQDYFAVVLRGTARTRQSLVLFSDNLKKNPIVKSVDLPVSDLAKDSNISFTMTINGAI